MSNVFCKKINNNSQFIEIDCDGELINFNCVGESKGTIPFDNSDDNNLEIINLGESNTKGIYETKNIIVFSKLISISEELSSINQAVETAEIRWLELSEKTV